MLIPFHRGDLKIETALRQQNISYTTLHPTNTIPQIYLKIIKTSSCWPRYRAGVLSLGYPSLNRQRIETIIPTLHNKKLKLLHIVIICSKNKIRGCGVRSTDGTCPHVLFLILLYLLLFVRYPFTYYYYCVWITYRNRCSFYARYLNIIYLIVFDRIIINFEFLFASLTGAYCGRINILLLRLANNIRK